MKKTDNNTVNEIEQLASSITEGSKLTLKNILNEAVSNYLREEVLNEDEDEDDDETNNKNNKKSSKVEEFDNMSDDTTEDEDDTTEDEDDTAEDEDNPTEDDDNTTEVEEDTIEKADVDTDSDEDEWSNFEEYKIGNDDGSEEYDFTNETNPETLVKVFKLMKNDDQVSVVKDDETIKIKDNEADTEYVIELDCETSNYNNNDEENIYELTMAESLGYTDNYQDKDPIEGLSMGDSPKNTKDWHKGVPTGTKKPWAGKGSSKPFSEKVEKVFEITLNDGIDNEDEFVDEATNVGGYVQQNSTSKSHVPNSSGRKARNMSKGGEKKTSTSTPRYSGMNESIQMKALNKALQENKKLKETVNKVANIMKEAVQVNVNLGHIVRLMVENSTTKQEKEDIIRRFNSVKTNNEAKNLYESISSELKKSKNSVITEQATTVQSSKKINESKIYDDTNTVLDLMKRMNMIK